MMNGSIGVIGNTSYQKITSGVFGQSNESVNNISENAKLVNYLMVDKNTLNAAYDTDRNFNHDIYLPPKLDVKATTSSDAESARNASAMAELVMMLLPGMKIEHLAAEKIIEAVAMMNSILDATIDVKMKVAHEIGEALRKDYDDARSSQLSAQRKNAWWCFAANAIQGLIHAACMAYCIAKGDYITAAIMFVMFVNDVVTATASALIAMSNENIDPDSILAHLAENGLFYGADTKAVVGMLLSTVTMLSPEVGLVTKAIMGIGAMCALSGMILSACYDNPDDNMQTIEAFLANGANLQMGIAGAIPALIGACCTGASKIWDCSDDTIFIAISSAFQVLGVLLGIAAINKCTAVDAKSKYSQNLLSSISFIKFAQAATTSQSVDGLASAFGGVANGSGVIHASGDIENSSISRADIERLKVNKDTANSAFANVEQNLLQLSNKEQEVIDDLLKQINSRLSILSRILKNLSFGTTMQNKA